MDISEPSTSIAEAASMTLNQPSTSTLNQPFNSICGTTAVRNQVNTTQPNQSKRKPEQLDQHFINEKKPALGEETPAETIEVDTEDCGSTEDEEKGGGSSRHHQISSETQNWIDAFQGWSHVDRISALSILVERCNLAQIRHLRDTIEPHFQKDFISELPKELSLMVLGNLEAKDLARAACVSRYWQTVTEDYLLWKEKCEEANLQFSDYPTYGAAVASADHAGEYSPLTPNDSFSNQSAPPLPTGAMGGRASCYERAPWKALYLRHCKVNKNWRNRDCRPVRQLLRGHEEHVITCLQINGERIVSGSDDNTLKIWSAITGKCLQQLIGHTGGVWSSQITADGSTILSGSTDRTVRVWDAETGNCLHTLTGHTSTVRCMAVRNRTLVSGSRDTTLRVWNIDTGETLHVLQGHCAAVRCVQFDGKRVVSGSYDFTVKVWDYKQEKCIHTLNGHSNRVYSLQLDSDRDLVISGSLDTSIRVWNLGNGQCTHNLMGHQSLTSGMQLRGRILVSGNADSTVKVWDILDGQCLHTLSGPNRHTSAVTSLQFLANGLVVTSSDDGTVKLWDAKHGTFVRDVVELDSRESGGCIWRLKATSTKLVCAVGSRTGTEDTKLILLDFDASYP